MTALNNLPCDGIFTREDFDDLPALAQGWAWELRNGRLELVHMPVTLWHWKIILLVLGYWESLGHDVGGEQYVADSGFARGSTGKHNFVADGVVFLEDYQPEINSATQDAANIHVVVEAVSTGSEENAAVAKFKIYAQLGIEHYWIVRGDPETKQVDGLVSMYELHNGEYVLTGQRMASDLTAS